MKIHGLLLRDQSGADVMETLCNRVVAPHRDPQTKMIKYFVTTAGNQMQCVFEPRDTTCQTCQFIWRNIRK